MLVHHVARPAPNTYIDHSIRSDAEEGGSLVDRLDLLPSLHGHLQTLEFAQGTLQGCPVLSNEVITCAEVIELADEYLQGTLNLTAIRLRRRLLVPRVIWRGRDQGSQDILKCFPSGKFGQHLTVSYPEIFPIRDTLTLTLTTAQWPPLADMITAVAVGLVSTFCVVLLCNGN